MRGTCSIYHNKKTHTIVGLHLLDMVLFAFEQSVGSVVVAVHDPLHTAHRSDCHVSVSMRGAARIQRSARCPMRRRQNARSLPAINYSTLSTVPYYGATVWRRGWGWGVADALPRFGCMGRSDTVAAASTVAGRHLRQHHASKGGGPPPHPRAPNHFPARSLSSRGAMKGLRRAG